MPRPMWVERGADGHPFFVREKLALEFPSFRRTIAEAMHDLRHPHTFHKKQSAAKLPSSDLQVHPRSNTEPEPQLTSSNVHQTTSALDTRPDPQEEAKEKNNASSKEPHQNSHMQDHTFAPFQYQPLQAFPSSGPMPLTNGGWQLAAQAPQQPTTIPAYTPHYVIPHPRMYPYVPAGNQAIEIPSAMQQNYRNDTSRKDRPTIDQKHHLVGHEPVAINNSLSRIIDTIPKCKICGRPRSPRYQWKHPLLPGQTPTPSVCRRCRKEETDSEPDNAAHGEVRINRRRSRSRRASKNGHARSRRRAKSSNKENYQDGDNYYYSSESQSSTAGSSELQEFNHSPRRIRYHRTSSPEVDTVRNVDKKSHSNSRRPKTMTVQGYHTDDENLDGSDVDVRRTHRPTRRTISRPGTPTRPPFVRFQSDNYDMHVRAGTGRGAYRSAAFVDDSYRYRQPRFRDRYTRSNSAADTYHDGSLSDETAEDDDLTSSNDYHATRCYIRGGNRDWVDTNGEDTRNVYHHVAMAPTYHAPPYQSQASAYIDRSEPDKSKYPPNAYSRQRTGSLGRKSSEATRKVDDYDWYDKDGMRVRVREV